VLGKNPRLLQSGRHGPEHYAAVWRELDAHGCWLGEMWNRRKDGQDYACLQSISVVRNALGQPEHYVSLSNDITPIKDHARQLDHIMHFDALTGLPNRILLVDRLQQAIANSQRHKHPLALAYFDLDGFKAINDTYGHAAGDSLLKTLAGQIKASLREGDTLARVGGDEFVALLVDMENFQEYQSVLQRLLEAVAQPVVLGNTQVHISASIGVTVFPQDGSDADQLMRHADQAMLMAKQAGKNCYHLFDIAHDANVKAQREGVEQIVQALNRSEFVLYYQPKVNMSTGLVIGAEALIRWQHPQRGLLAPALFLPLIEDHPASLLLGEWVVQSALAQMSQWRTQGLDLQVSVNISAGQLQDSNFPTRLAELLAAQPDVPAHMLELEILETTALEDITHVLTIMQACHALGVSFALDDFGTGYSSLTYLRRLPVELLKIDQSFVRDMLDDQADLAIVKGVIGLAEAFRRTVIAEGVETTTHGEMLLQLGCQLAQGYGISRPMPAQELPHWVATWKPDQAWLAQ
ncbi:MAG: putative bifunctional diguanylate cyclase/phosphodiesterase, partial [Rhodoferax sp.]